MRLIDEVGHIFNLPINYSNNQQPTSHLNTTMQQTCNYAVKTLQNIHNYIQFNSFRLNNLQLLPFL